MFLSLHHDLQSAHARAQDFYTKHVISARVDATVASKQFQQRCRVGVLFNERRLPLRALIPGQDVCLQGLVMPSI